MTEPPLTRREDDVPATRRESDTAGATRREGDAPETQVWRRVRLPQPLEERFEHLFDIEESGAQADIAVCRDRETGVEVAVKLYRVRADRIDRDAIEALRGCDPSHVVPLHEVDTWGNAVWEVQEYFPLGSLAAFLESRATVPRTVAAMLFSDIASDIRYIHGRNIVHRDIKPQNILMRGHDPVDCVLADFGLATGLALSADLRSVAGTFAYAGPEVHHGVLTFANDWWALGVIMYEVLTGRHLFAEPGGERLLSDPQIRQMVGEDTFEVPSVGDARWDLLLAGLLTHKREHRWGSEETLAWERGESPKVHRPSSDDRKSRGEVRPFPFGGGTFTDPVALAASLRDNWREAAEMMLGRKADELRMWLHTTDVGQDADHLFQGVGPDAAVVRLQAVLDPQGTVAFRGVSLDDVGIQGVLDRARSGDTQATEWLRAMREQRVLTAWAAENGHVSDEVRMADDRLSQWWKEVDGLLGPLGSSPDRDLAGPARAELEWLLFAAALDPSQQTGLLAQAKSIQGSARNVPAWAGGLMSASESFAGAATVVAVIPAASRVETARVDAAAEREREAERARATQRRVEARRTRGRRIRRHLAGWWFPFAVLAGLWLAYRASLLGALEQDVVVPTVVGAIVALAVTACWHFFAPLPDSGIGYAVMCVGFFAGLAAATPPSGDGGLWLLYGGLVVGYLSGNAVGLLVDRLGGTRGNRLPVPVSIAVGAGALAFLCWLGEKWNEMAVVSTQDAPFVWDVDLGSWYSGPLFDIQENVTAFVAEHSTLAGQGILVVASVLAVVLWFGYTEISGLFRPAAIALAVLAFVIAALALVGHVLILGFLLYAVGAVALFIVIGVLLIAAVFSILSNW